MPKTLVSDARPRSPNLLAVLLKVNVAERTCFNLKNDKLGRAEAVLKVCNYLIGALKTGMGVFANR